MHFYIIGFKCSFVSIFVCVVTVGAVELLSLQLENQTFCLKTSGFIFHFKQDENIYFSGICVISDSQLYDS